MMSALLLGVLTVLAPTQPSLPAPNTSIATPHVVVTTTDNGDQRTYIATVFNSNNQIVPNAELDMSAMTDNPDARIGTAPMTPRPGTTGRFERTLEFPAAGDWVLVVRVHAPNPFVQLLTERVDSANLPNASAHADTPSRRHLRELAPDFSQRYDPLHGIGSTDPQPLMLAQQAATAQHHNEAPNMVSSSDETNSSELRWFWAICTTAIAALAIRNINHTRAFAHLALHCPVTGGSYESTDCHRKQTWFDTRSGRTHRASDVSDHP